MARPSTCSVPRVQEIPGPQPEAHAIPGALRLHRRPWLDGRDGTRGVGFPGTELTRK